MKILQVGQTNYEIKAKIKNGLKWSFCREDHLAEFLKPYNLKKNPRRFDFGVVIFTSPITAEQIRPLQKFLSAYRVVILKGLKLEQLAKQYCAWQIAESDLPAFMQDIKRDFYMEQYGDNEAIGGIDVARAFTGEVKYRGLHNVELDGDFGAEFTPIASYRRGFYVDKNVAIDLWPVYEKSDSVELKYVVRYSHLGAIGTQKTIEFSGEQLEKPLTVESLADSSTISVNVWAKGKGSLALGNINNRWSRHQYGTLIMGGQRFTDHKRQEFFYYVDPGNLKPPLTVYFAGFQPRTGFEGYYMMKSFKHPFILFADPRLEGGSFYLGTPEYEAKIAEIITETLAKLGFTKDQLVLSGLSMGTTGAIYYGAKVGARAVIVGKPLLKLGTLALNNTLHRSNEFDTALDLLLQRQGENSVAAAKRFDEQMVASVADSKLASGEIFVAYMREDDYDGAAFYELVENLQDKVKIIGHGYTGRHNDASSSVVGWFLKQYRAAISEIEEESQNETDPR